MECMAIYRPREQDNYFLCLGSRGKWAALGMPVKRVQASGQHYFILGAEPALDWHFTQVPILEHDMTGGYMGVRTVAWPPSELPESMANLGVVWKQSAEEEPLLRFAFRTAGLQLRSTKTSFNHCVFRCRHAVRQSQKPQ